MADYLPKHTPGQAITLTASAAVTGGRLVAVSGAGTVAPAGADSAAVVGVAGFDWLTEGQAEPLKALLSALVAGGVILAARRLVRKGRDTGG